MIPHPSLKSPLISKLIRTPDIVRPVPMGMYHCRKRWGKGVATWGNHLLAIFLGLNITVLVLLI